MSRATETAKRAILIIMDGVDGSGKTTQIELLAKRLKNAGRKVGLLSFPVYDSGGCHFVKRYLAGDYGSLEEVNPKAASLFFALDRYDARAEIKKALADNEVVVSDRGVSSNMIHQGSKINNPRERLAFFEWIYELEFEILGFPKPTLNIILDVPLEISLAAMRKRNAESGTKPDIHEQDARHQEKSRRIYQELYDNFTKDFKRLNCATEDGQLLKEEQINEMIWRIIEPRLLQT